MKPRNPHREEIQISRTIISAIREKSVLEFVYHGERRIAEPQTYGISSTGKRVLRAYQRSEGRRAGTNSIAKLFDVAKIGQLKKTGKKFTAALSVHNPDDSAMVEIFATLPKISSPKPKVTAMTEPEALVGDEWAEWYRLTPLQRWQESEKLWQTYLALGGSLDPEPDTQSPFFDANAPRPRPAHGRAGLRVLRRSRV